MRSLPPGPIVLASASPRRRELLERLGFELEVVPADVDEAVRPGEAPLDYVRRVAADKARAVPRDGWVLAADTIVELDGVVLGKAADADEARAMLSALRGRTHRVSTAFVVRGPRVMASPGFAGARSTASAVRSTIDGLVTSEVDMVFDEVELEDYVACGEWRGKAGAYAVQGIGGALVSAVRGSISNVIGLPLREVVAALAEVGAAAPRFTNGRPA